MKEIAEDVFIETEMLGVTLGAIFDQKNLIYVDAPLLPENARSWRSVVNGKRKAEPALVLLDSNLDRTIGSRYMDCSLIAQEQVLEVYENRPITFKPLPLGSGADWEKIRSMNGFRWIYPEIIFSHTLDLHQNELHIQFEFHPGPSLGSSWVLVPERKVLFVGDILMNDQVPLIQEADLNEWQESLSVLAGPAFQDYMIISGRSGVLKQSDVEPMQAFLSTLNQLFFDYAECGASISHLDSLISEMKIDQFFRIRSAQKGNSIKRLRYGMCSYYQQHFLHETAAV